RPDKFASVEQDIGATASEEFLVELANLLKSHLGAHDVAGRLGGVSFLALLERGNEHDVEVWSEQLVAKAARHVVTLKEKALSVTCTVGLSVVPSTNANLDATIADALESCRKGRQRGGNQVFASDDADTDARVKSYDTVWVKHIKAALMENRFRLVQQP